MLGGSADGAEGVKFDVGEFLANSGSRAAQRVMVLGEQRTTVAALRRLPPIASGASNLFFFSSESGWRE